MKHQTCFTKPALQMAGTVIDYMEFSEDPGQEYAVMVNNLGTTSCMEMGVLLNAVAKHLSHARKMDISRMYCGTFMTATDMGGFSISIMHLNTRRKAFLDDPTQVTLCSVCQMVEMGWTKGDP